MNIKTLISSFLLTFSTIGYASTVTPTSIKLNPTAIHDITITATQGVQNVWQYEFNITGGDPYMLSMPITAAIGSANHVLTFEYQSNMAIGFEVFYSLNQTDIIGGRSRVLGNLEATGTGVWRTASFDIAYDMSRFGWGNTVGDFLRFDFGSNGSGTFKIRNIHITNYDYATSQQRAHKTININSEGVYFIQAEDYDNGGVGVAYYNRTTGTSTYRDDSNLAAITSNSAYTAISDMGNDWDAYTLGAFIDGSSNKISTDAAIQNWGAWYNYTIYSSEDIDVDISIRAGVHFASWGAITTYGAYKSYGKARGTASPYGYTVNQIGEDWVKRYSAAMVLSLDGKNLKTV
ncbi:MAG: hypothetical protein IK092_01425, partial [Muribaculaceae bacterium]|nr:hypothetical protein [Muribaculaceae bacterium]